MEDLTVSEFSRRTGIREYKVREWLRNRILKGAKTGPSGQWMVDPSMIGWWQQTRSAIRRQKGASNAS
jgi:hypothetical protein